MIASLPPRPTARILPLARILAIANQKGGVGKTTTAVNLAAFLALAGSRTLLVDLDPQGNATTGLSAPKRRRRGTFQLLVRTGDPLEATIPIRSEGLDLAPADVSLLEAQAQLSRSGVPVTALRAPLDVLGERYDHILIDCPPSLGPLTRLALGAAAAVVVPIQCEFFALEGLSQILNVIRHVARRANPALTLEGVLLTMYDPSLGLSREVEQDVLEHFGSRVYRHPIPRDVLLAEAASYGRSVLRYAPFSRGAHGYAELAREVLEHDRPEAGTGTRLSDR
jgi:chromosome partitioning protein